MITDHEIMIGPRVQSFGVNYELKLPLIIRASDHLIDHWPIDPF